MSETWYLVQVHGWSKPYWMEEGDAYGDEEYWRNRNGGRTPKSPEDKVFESVEAEYEDLDHKKTGLFLEESSTGWLGRSGDWHPCEFTHHDNYAELVLRSTTKLLNATGWVRVYGVKDWHCDRRLTAEQRNWLLRYGYEVTDDE